MFPDNARDGTPLLKRSSAVLDALAILSDRWTFVILMETFFGVNRFDDYQHNLGISRNVLTKRLGSLVDDGLLRRHLYQSKPDRFEYRLTDKGRDMYPVFLALQQWGNAHLGGDERLDWHLVHEDCGQPTWPHMCCDKCGLPIRVPAIHVVANGPSII